MIQRSIAGVALATSFIGFSGVAHAYDALPNLPNLTFTQVQNQPKGTFSHVNPTGWTGGNGLIFIDSQTAPGQDAAGPVYLQTYGDPQGTVPGNYVEADGNPTYESGFNYTITGLTVGKTYTLAFYQGASTQTGFGFNNYVGRNTGTTNQWIVSLGTAGLQLKGGGPVDPLYGPTDVYYNTDGGASVTASPLMTVPYQGTVGWQYVSVNLTADATTDILSFLAWGDNGSTVNLPPIAFLAGVDQPAGEGVPEPAAMAVVGAGLFGLGGLSLRSRVRRS